MKRVTLEIRVRQAQLREVESLVGSNRLYKKGTDSSQYLDLRDRAEADLLVVNLGLIPGVKARILGG
jgi:hypothetical protein